MSATNIRRYVFMEYSTLSWETLKKLEKISTKIFIFVPAHIQNIPFGVVQAAQKIGNRLKWLAVDVKSSEFLSSHIAFVLGSRHERAAIDIEFAIVSESDAYDNFIVFINSMGRKCLRINIENEDNEETDTDDEDGDEVQTFTSPIEHNDFIKTPHKTEHLSEAAFSESKVSKPAYAERMNKMARTVVEKMIRSGERPVVVNDLTNYLAHQCPELQSATEVNKIIGYMIDGRDISILNEEVVYHF